MRALLLVAAVSTVACRSVPSPAELPPTHPGSMLAAESAMPELRGPATDVVAPRESTTTAPMPGMGGGGR